MSVKVDCTEKRFSLLDQALLVLTCGHYCSLTPAVQKVCITENSFISHRIWTAGTFVWILLWSYHINKINSSPKNENSVRNFFTLMLFQTCMTDFLPWNMKGEVWQEAFF